MGSGQLVLRTVVGSLMTGHGLQKLTGSFGGGGLGATEQMLSSIEVHPARQQALAVALSETVGGSLTAAGLFSPLGPAMITGVMAVAIKKVHAKNGLWNAKGGYELNLLLTAAAFELATAGPGRLSLDHLAGRHRAGIGWGLLELALGLAGAAGVLALAEKTAPGAPHEEPEAPTVLGSEQGPATAAPDEGAAQAS